MNHRPAPVTVYSPESSIRRPGSMFREMFSDFWRGKELAWRLALRDIRAQYRQAALDLLWAFIFPLTHTLTWIFLSGSGIVWIKSTGMSYPIYVFTGTIIWAIFMDAINAPLNQTIAAKPMLSKINFPREALVVSEIFQVLFNGANKIAVVLSALMLMGLLSDWHILLFPLGVFSLIAAGTAIGLLITPIGVLYSDIGKSLPLLMQFWMYLTPVVFPMPKGGLTATIFNLYPLTPLIITCRNWLIGKSSEVMAYFTMVNSAVVILLFIVWNEYRAAMPILIERMSA